MNFFSVIFVSISIDTAGFYLKTRCDSCQETTNKKYFLTFGKLSFLPCNVAVLARYWELQFCPSIRLSVVTK